MRTQGVLRRQDKIKHFSFHQVNLSVRQINLKAGLLRISFEPEIKKSKVMKRSMKIMFVLLIQSISLSAQSVLSGRIIDKDSIPMASATILLLKHPDSTYITGTASNPDGRFEILNLKPDNYILSFSMMGFKKINIPQQVGQSANNELGDIILEEDVYMLSGVTIMGKRPPFKVEMGKTIVNLSSALLSTDGNIYEALKKLPGVIIQNDGTIILNGKVGANVLINDKATYLSGENLVNYLRSIPAASVENVELISNPSSKYDAAGTSGIINIQKRKVTERGMNMTVSSGLESGKYTRGNEKLSLIFRYNKFNIYTDYSFYWGRDQGDVVSSRQYLDPITYIPSELRQDMEANRKMRYRSNYIRTGIDYDLSERVTVGTYFAFNRLNRNKNELSTTDFFNSNVTQSDSTLSAGSILDFHYTNITGGAEISYKWKEKRKWDTSFDYQIFDQGDNQVIKSVLDNYIDHLNKDTLSGKTTGDIKIFSGQTNLNYDINGKFKINTGIKSVFVKIDNAALYENLINGNRLQNNNLSSNFSYNENINAGYAQLNSIWSSRFSSEIGVRIENTNIKNHYSSNANDSVFNNSYTYLFPTIMAQYVFSDNHLFSIIYNRRINRPNYRDLNPFIEVRDNFLHEKGNTNLKPELIDNLELALLIKRQYTVNLFYSNRKNPITKSYLVEENNRILVMPLNLSQNHSIGLRFGLNNLKPFRWWTTHLNGSLTHKQFQWVSSGKVKKNKITTPMIHLSNQLSLPYGWGMEVVGYYNGYMAEGQAEIHPLWTVSAGIRKNLFDNKISLYIFANDIFLSNRPYINLQGDFIDGWYKERYDSRMVGISLSYRFNRGKETKNSGRDNRIDESKRINM